MTNYVKTTNFATKDSLVSGDANKVVKGTELNSEFDNIVTAIATKADTSALAPFTDAVSLLKNSSDTTKLAQFSAASITTATTRILTIQDKNYTLAGLDDIPIKSSSLQSITSSVAASAFTANYNGGTLDFHNANSAIGIPNTLSIAANAIVVPFGATLGMTNGVQARLPLIEAYNGGSPVACIFNSAGGLQLDEANLISPTTISAGATSANVIYSASAVSANSPYRVVGFFDITEVTAGTWATDATLKQGAGGQALKSLPTNSMVRLNTANGYGTTNTVIRRFLNTVTNQGSDITYTDSATLGGTFTINTNGVYAISYSDNFNAPGFSGISLNSNQLTTGIQSINALNAVTIGLGNNTTNSGSTCAATMFLNIGDVIRAHSAGIGVGSSPNTVQFIIAKVAS